MRGLVLGPAPVVAVLCAGNAQREQPVWSVTEGRGDLSRRRPDEVRLDKNDGGRRQNVAQRLAIERPDGRCV